MSDYKTTKHRDRWESLWLRLKPTAHSARKLTIYERPLPRFLSVADFVEGEQFTVSIPTARRSWWFWSLLFVATMWLMLTPIIFAWSINLPFYDNRGRFYDGSFSYGAFLFGIVVLVGLTWLVWWWAFPRIRITADHSSIRVHDRVYDWNSAEGFRLGYSLGGVERIDKEGPFAGLRMAYGPWGDDLPYMVRHYYAPAYVLFLNDCLKAIEPRTPDTMAESGIKAAMF